MDSLKTKSAVNFKERESAAALHLKKPNLVSAPIAVDLCAHFSDALNQFGPLSVSKVESNSGRFLDLTHERIVRLEGAKSFICVVRTNHQLEQSLIAIVKNISRPAEGWFNQLVLEYAQRLTYAVYGPISPKGDTYTIRPSNPKYWPPRDPGASCRLLAGTSPVEIRFWLNLQAKSN